MHLRSLSLLLAGALLPATRAAVKSVTLVLTYGTTNQDGTTKPSWLINGTSPGPHLVWDEGDTVLATVINNGPEPMTMHWHGIEQKGTPWSDGVPGLTQYPIPAGGNFLYNFTLFQSGFHWYHSHYKMQLDDGLKGTVNAGYKGINMKNPPFRDDFVTPVDMSGKAWAAMRFLASDPGPWIMHCHIDAHLVTGMVVILLEGAEKLVPGYVPNQYLTKNKPS
ncbi:Multicopper oxidase [Ceratobasidium sp. AG-Ba]|nr:Multicopper oxidase [Ceratobasidium sp. AG-Ba]QRW10713.1 Multicopper oxidase [Ceratobasidium sp. AG-Ba]